MTAENKGKTEKNGIIKRGKTWSYRLRVPDLNTGKTQQIRKSGFQTFKEAQADRDLTRNALLKGEYVTQHSISVEQFLNEWIEVHATTLKPTTEAEYRARLRLYVIPLIGKLQLRNLRPTDIQKMYLTLLKEGGKSGTPLSAKSVENIGAVLKRALQHALDVEQLISRNPASRVPMPKGVSKRNVTWTHSELNAFLGKAESHRLFAFFRLSAFTGARRSELLGLKWSDLDLESKRVSIERVRVKTRYGVQEVATTKGGDGRRVVTLDETTLKVLRDHKRRQAEDRLRLGEAWTETGYLFVQEDGLPIDPDTPSQLFTSLRKRLGLPEQRLHDLRHIHATELLRAGVPLHVVADRLGHKDAMVTATIYAHVRQDQAESVAEIFAKAVEN
jgi:integrase